MAVTTGSIAGTGMGRMGGFAKGPGGKCKCPLCGYTMKHARGKPCMDTACPKCGAKMIRERLSVNEAAHLLTGGLCG